MPNLNASAADAAAWPDGLFGVLKEAGISQVGYVPDGRHARLIDSAAPIRPSRTCAHTEEEGGRAGGGAWLGGGVPSC